MFALIYRFYGTKRVHLGNIYYVHATPEHIDKHVCPRYSSFSL